MSWEDQGRQEHGWFGHGTAPPHLTDDHDRSGRFGPGGLDERIRAIGMCAIAGLPARLRYHHAARIEGAKLERFARVMRAWVWGLRLDRARFAAEFFSASSNYPAAEHLRHAAWFAATAHGSADIREATDHLAAVMQEVGLDRWRRFLGDAEQRAAPVPVKPPATVLASAVGVLSVSDVASGAAASSGAGLSAVARSGAAALPRAAMVLGPLGVPLAVLGVLWPKQIADDTLTGLGMPIGGGAAVAARGPNTLSTPAAPALPRGVSTPAPSGLQGPQVTATPAAPALPSVQQGPTADGLQGPQIAEAKAASPLKAYDDDPGRLQGRAPADVEAEMDRVLVQGAGWSKRPSNDGNGVAYRDNRGGLLIINKGYGIGVMGGQGDSLHQGAYVKISAGGQITRIPLMGNPALLTGRKQ